MTINTLTVAMIALLACQARCAPHKQIDLDAFWNLPELRKTPLEVEVVATRTERGYRLDEMYFTSAVTETGKNRIFCAFARPVNPPRRVPLLLLIHGGGGHTDAKAALWWAQSLRAATIYLDWSGEFIPGAERFTQWKTRFPNPYSDMVGASPDLHDSMLYHIVVSAVRALDFASEQPEVDMRFVASFGGSWGGFISLLLAGVDSRVGCVLSGFGAGGWAGAHSGLTGGLQSMPAEQNARWLEVFDPLAYAPRTRASVMISAATNDYFFWLGGVQRNFEALAGCKRIVMLPNSDHGVGGPAMPDVTYHWIHRYFVSQRAWPEVVPGSLMCRGRAYTWRAAGPKTIKKAVLYWSPGKVVWPARYWMEIPAELKSDIWTAQIPAELSQLRGEVFVTVFDEDGLAVSTSSKTRGGVDPNTTAGPLWSGGALWDRQRGAAAWRPFGHQLTKVEIIAADSLRISPSPGATHFGTMTNSVVLASGHAAVSKGIRIKINGQGQPGKLSIRLLRDSRSAREIAYGTVIDYTADETVVELLWSVFKGPEGAPSIPYPFDGLVLEGDRTDGSAIVVDSLELCK